MLNLQQSWSKSILETFMADLTKNGDGDNVAKLIFEMGM